MSSPESFDKHNNLVIAGGGCSGTVAVIALAQTLSNRKIENEATSWHLFDPAGFGNGGIAYGQSGNALLNDTADAMSPWQPGAFVAWCADRDLGNDPKAFQERRLYGEFLRVEFAHARKVLQQHGISIIEHREAVTDISESRPGRFTIKSDGITLANLPASNIILAPGYGRSDAFTALDGKPNYIASIYPPEKLQTALAEKPDAKLLVLGTGPALYDVLRLLPESFTGAITAVSSTGKCPGRRDTGVEGKETRWSLHQEYNRAATADDLNILIQHDLAKAHEQGSTTRRIALDIQKNLPALLGQLDPNEQGKFWRGHISQLFHACTPVPGSSRQILDDLRRQNRFNTREGRLQATDITRSEQGFHVSPDCNRNRAEAIDIVINCTGHNPLNSSLVKMLIDNELAEKRPGLPLLKTGEDGYRLLGNNLACVGPPTHLGLHGMESFWPAIQGAAKNLALSVSQPCLDRKAELPKFRPVGDVSQPLPVYAI